MSQLQSVHVGHGLACRGTYGIRHAQIAEQLAVARHDERRPPGVTRGIQRGRNHRPRSMPMRCEELFIADERRTLGVFRNDPLPRDGGELLRRLDDDVAFFGGGRNATRQRMRTELLAAAAAYFNSDSCSTPGNVAISTTRGRPSVRVPVLSNTTVVIDAAASIAEASLNSNPLSAPRPDATITAVGVAKPSAQGHATTSTAVKAERPRAPIAGQRPTRERDDAIANTIGTNTAVTRSAKR